MLKDFELPKSYHTAEFLAKEQVFFAQPLSNLKELYRYHVLNTFQAPTFFSFLCILARYFDFANQKSNIF